MNRCPDEKLLRELLDETLDRMAYETVEAHIENCQACKDTLDHLTADSAWPWIPANTATIATRRADRPRAAASAMNVPGYDVIRELGRGGHGIVYEAVQVGLNRRVALKVMKQGSDADPDDVERFRREAAVVAKLQHPNIVQVYAVGECNGAPFFAMELLEGGSLARLIKGTPQSARTAAELAVTLARALDAAHERGIVHRDLKPGNVLLAADGTPKVSDFGMAKQLYGPANTTTSVAVFGTPSYMAPEQASGQSKSVGPTADVYSLGVILYELLTGRPPFQAETSWETVRQVREHEPVPPGRLQPALAKDLETICLKCLQKEPQRRYATTAALAEDLERFLNGEPIQARPAGVLERAGRWYRRRPLVSGLVTALVLLFLCAFAGVISLWRVAESRGVAFQRQKDEADRERARADEQQRIGRRAVRNMTKFAENDLPSEPGAEKLRRELLQIALNFYQQVAQVQSRDTLVRFERAQAYFFAGRIQSQLGFHEEAAEDFRQQIAILEELARELPNEANYRFDLFVSRQHLSSALRTIGQISEGDNEQWRAFEIIKQLAADVPHVPNYRDALANAGCSLGGVLLDHGEYRAAEELLCKSIDIAEQLSREFPNKRTPPHYPANVAHGLGGLARTLRAMGRSNEAEAAIRRAITVMNELVTAVPEETGYVSFLAGFEMLLARELLDTGRLPEAQEFIEKAIDHNECVIRVFPSIPGYKHDLAHQHSVRGSILFEAGGQESGEEEFEIALSLLRELVGEFRHTHSYLSDLARLLCTCPIDRLRDPNLALELVEQVVNLAPDLNDTWLTLGLAHYSAGNWQAAVDAELERLKRAPNDDPRALLVLSASYSRLGNNERARHFFDLTSRYLTDRPSQNPEIRLLRGEAADLLQTILSPSH